MNDLSGLHIIVTRPSAQAEPWAKKLRDLGAFVDIISLMSIVPFKNDSHKMDVRQTELDSLEEPAQIRAIKNCILDFDQYQKAIFVSQNAVEQGFEWIDNYWPQLPLGIEYFAVGETTAQRLQQKGVSVTDLAQTQAGAMTSETLLQSPALQQVANEKIIIFRGVGGRSHLGEQLMARGAQVDYCEVYKRCMPNDAVEQFKSVLQKIKSVTQGKNEIATVAESLVITLHSGEALENLQAVLAQVVLQMTAQNILSETAKDEIKNLLLLVPSVRVYEQALAAGFKNTWVAANATDACMLQGLIDLKHHFIKV